MLLSFLTFVAVLVFVVALLYPQLRQSVTQLVRSLPEYGRRLIEWSQEYLPGLDLETRIQEFMQKYMTMDALQDLLSNAAPHLFSLTSSTASVITDFVLALMLSFYLLLSKNKLVRQAKSVLNAYAPRLARVVLPVATRLNDKFRKFLGGQITEAVILGMLCFIGMTVLSLPYAPLVSTLVGVTAVIPIFGAYIGAIVSAFLILMDNPLSAVIFLVFLVVLQQVEGNLIYPRVVGDSIGLSGLWVLLAVIVGGGFFGIPGIFVGIPVMSVIYDLVREDLARRRPGERRPGAKPFVRLTPLATVIAARLGRGEQTKTVQRVYETLISQLGPELFLLREAPSPGDCLPCRRAGGPGNFPAAPGQAGLAARL